MIQGMEWWAVESTRQKVAVEGARQRERLAVCGMRFVPLPLTICDRIQSRLDLVGVVKIPLLMADCTYL